LAEPSAGLRLEAFRPEARKLETDFSEAIKKRTGDEPLASHRLAGSGLWLLKVVLDQAKTDDLDRFRAAVLALDMPVGSMLNGWGVKFADNGQNANERVQHYMLQWQNGKMNTVWPEEFTTLRAKWIPLGPWDQRK
jgi:branched-chain amino acid transport system substrate-binding protein